MRGVWPGLGEAGLQGVGPGCLPFPCRELSGNKKKYIVYVPLYAGFLTMQYLCCTLNHSPPFSYTPARLVVIRRAVRVENSAKQSGLPPTDPPPLSLLIATAQDTLLCVNECDWMPDPNTNVVQKNSSYLATQIF